MEQNKLKKLALILQDEFPESSIQELWSRYRGYAKTHSDYFSKLNVHSFLKVFIYVYSLLKTNDFKLADSILENMFFSYLLQRSDDTYSDDCGQCGGDGNIECYDCDGTGTESCSECDGEGQIDCSECGGEGKVEDESGDMVDCLECEGSGKEECDICDGDGRVDCSNCDGNGKNECDDCYGSGSIEEEDKYEYFTFFVCSWNKDFYNRCELTENKIEPTINDEDFDDLSEKLILSETSDYQYLDTDMEVDDMYCLYVSDTPNLYLGYNFELKLGWTPSIDKFKV